MWILTGTNAALHLHMYLHVPGTGVVVALVMLCMQEHYYICLTWMLPWHGQTTCAWNQIYDVVTHHTHQVSVMHACMCMHQWLWKRTVSFHVCVWQSCRAPCICSSCRSLLGSITLPKTSILAWSYGQKHACVSHCFACGGACKQAPRRNAQLIGHAWPCIFASIEMSSYA